MGSSPTTGTTSEQALYRLLRLFSKVTARSCRCSSLSKSQPPCWVVVWFWVPTRNRGIYAVAILHVAADVISFAAIFCYKYDLSITAPAFSTFQGCTSAFGWVSDADLSPVHCCRPCRSKLYIACSFLRPDSSPYHYFTSCVQQKGSFPWAIFLILREPSPRAWGFPLSIPLI